MATAVSVRPATMSGRSHDRRKPRRAGGTRRRDRVGGTLMGRPEASAQTWSAASVHPLHPAMAGLSPIELPDRAHCPHPLRVRPRRWAAPALLAVARRGLAWGHDRDGL